MRIRDWSSDVCSSDLSQTAARDSGIKHRSHRMNTPGHDHDAREWEAQEHARRQARTAAVTNPPAARGSGSSRDLSPAVERSPASPHEAGDAAYRHVAEALRRPPPVDLPPAFAARAARLPQARPAPPAAGHPATAT